MTLQAEIVDKVMSLPIEERAELARQLILSLEPAGTDTPEEVAAAWEQEIERRIAQVDRGEVEPIDAREAIERARQSLRERKGK